MESPAPLRSNPRALVALLLMPLFFSTNIVVARAAVATIPPWTLVFWRWAVAALILLPFAAPELLRNASLLRRRWWQLLLLGMLVTVFCGGTVYIGLQYTTATNATLIYTTSTIMIVVFDAILSRRRLPVAHIAGAIVGFAGIAVVAVHGELGQLRHLALNIGDLGVFVSAVAWAIYSLMLRRAPVPGIAAIPAFTAIVIAGLIPLVPPMLWETWHGGHQPTGLHDWGQVLLIALFPSALAFTLYQYCVRVAGASISAVFLYLLPVYGVAMAVVLLGEELHPYHGAGFLLILAGVVLASRPAR